MKIMDPYLSRNTVPFRTSLRVAFCGAGVLLCLTLAGCDDLKLNPFATEERLAATGESIRADIGDIESHARDGLKDVPTNPHWNAILERVTSVHTHLDKLGDVTKDVEVLQDTITKLRDENEKNERKVWFAFKTLGALCLVGGIVTIAVLLYLGFAPRSAIFLGGGVAFAGVVSIGTGFFMTDVAPVLGYVLAGLIVFGGVVAGLLIWRRYGREAVDVATMVAVTRDVLNEATPSNAKTLATELAGVWPEYRDGLKQEGLL